MSPNWAELSNLGSIGRLIDLRLGLGSNLKKNSRFDPRSSLLERAEYSDRLEMPGLLVPSSIPS
jgi:hypothetical protein